MFSVTTACALDDETEADAAAQYYAELNREDRRRRVPPHGVDQEKAKKRQSTKTATCAKNRRPRLKQNLRSSKKGAKSGSAVGPSNFIAHVNRAPLAVALLGGPGEQRCPDDAEGEEEQEFDDSDEARDTNSCKSFLLNRRGCCSSEARSRSNDDETMFTFLETPRSLNCLPDKDYLDVPRLIDRRRSATSERRLSIITFPRRL